MATSFELNKSLMLVVIALLLGKCNNLGSEDQQDWGAAAIAMRRMTDRAYADEEGAPREVDVFFSRTIFFLWPFFSSDHFFPEPSFFWTVFSLPFVSQTVFSLTRSTSLREKCQTERTHRRATWPDPRGSRTCRCSGASFWTTTSLSLLMQVHIDTIHYLQTVEID